VVIRTFPMIACFAVMCCVFTVSVSFTEGKKQACSRNVADFHTCFVEDARILSHDITPRAPTNVLVPGLMPDETSAGSCKAVSKK